MDVLEGKILQMTRDVAQAEPRGNWHVDLERLLGDALALLGPHLRHRLQVVTAVSQLDQHDAQITRHGHQHLAEVLRLRILVGLEFNPVELGQAVDELGDFLAEPISDFRLGDRRILHHVVQEGGNNRLRIHAPLGERARNGQGMRNVGFAGKAGLAAMGLFAEAIRFEDVVDIVLREIAQGIDEDPVGRIFELINSGTRRGLRSGAVCSFGVLIHGHGRAPKGLLVAIRPDRD